MRACAQRKGPASQRGTRTHTRTDNSPSRSEVAEREREREQGKEGKGSREWRVPDVEVENPDLGEAESRFVVRARARGLL